MYVYVSLFYPLLSHVFIWQLLGLLMEFCYLHFIFQYDTGKQIFVLLQESFIYDTAENIFSKAQFYNIA